MTTTKRRGRGDGSIYFDATVNMWRGVLSLPQDAGGKRRRVAMTGKTRAEVRDKLRKAQAAIDAGLPTADVRYTVEDLLTDWIVNGLPGRSKNTVANYKWAVDAHLVPGLGHHRLRELTPDHVAKLLADRAASGMSRSTLNRLRSVLGQALRYAERRGRVARNVAQLVETPDGPAVEGRALTVEQAKALLTVARGDRLEPLVITGLMVGLRPGELLGLAWTDIDFEHAILHVRQALKREGGTLQLGAPKTARSRRAVTLAAPVVDALRAQRVRQAEERLAMGAAWQDHGLVFTTAMGTPMDPSNLRREFSRLTTTAGLGHWHPTELRHSAASLLSAAGVPIEQIADLLGHDGLRMTTLVYRHAVSPSVSAAVKPMERMFGGEAGSL